MKTKIITLTLLLCVVGIIISVNTNYSASTTNIEENGGTPVTIADADDKIISMIEDYKIIFPEFAAGHELFSAIEGVGESSLYDYAVDVKAALRQAYVDGEYTQKTFSNDFTSILLENMYNVIGNVKYAPLRKNLIIYYNDYCLQLGAGNGMQIIPSDLAMMYNKARAEYVFCNYDLLDLGFRTLSSGGSIAGTIRPGNSGGTPALGESVIANINYCTYTDGTLSFGINFSRTSENCTMIASIHTTRGKLITSTTEEILTNSSYARDFQIYYEDLPQNCILKVVFVKNLENMIPVGKSSSKTIMKNDNYGYIIATAASEEGDLIKFSQVKMIAKDSYLVIYNFARKIKVTGDDSIMKNGKKLDANAEGESAFGTYTNVSIDDINLSAIEDQVIAYKINSSDEITAIEIAKNVDTTDERFFSAYANGTENTMTAYNTDDMSFLVNGKKLYISSNTIIFNKDTYNYDDTKVISPGSLSDWQSLYNAIIYDVDDSGVIGCILIK